MIRKRKKATEETKKKLSISHIGLPKNKGAYSFPKGKDNPSWKGDNVGYSAIHSWIKRTLGKPIKCHVCKVDKIPQYKKRYFNWCNKSGNYKRDIKDWVQLCIPCHRRYDGHPWIKD